MRYIVNIEGRIPRHFFALAASRPPADQIILRAENARLRTSLTTVLTTELGIGQPAGVKMDSSHLLRDSDLIIPRLKPVIKLLVFFG